MLDDFVHVVVGLVQNENQILIAKRPEDKHQGGLWEFPGGKLETGETPFHALSRELREEVGIDINSADSFLKIHHHYADKSVFLDIYRIEQFSGQAHGHEGQVVKWVERGELNAYEFPAANQKILKSLLVPEQVSITPANITHNFDYTKAVQQALELNSSAILVRTPELDDANYLRCVQCFAKAISNLCVSEKMKLLINREFILKEKVTVDGLHLSSKALIANKHNFAEYLKTCKKPLLLSASCHNESELTKAQELACDFVFLSPIKQTSSHSQAQPLGWQAARTLLEKVELPVLFLGGLEPADIHESKDCGALGVAGISHFGMLG